MHVPGGRYHNVMLGHRHRAIIRLWAAGRGESENVAAAVRAALDLLAAASGIGEGEIRAEVEKEKNGGESL